MIIFPSPGMGEVREKTFWVNRGWQRALSESAASQLPSAQNYPYATVADLGWHILIPFINKAHF